MGKEKAFSEEKAYGRKLACGRTFDEEVAAVRQYGNHGTSAVLRNAVLAAHGIVDPKPKAANGIFFGCYRPFTTPFLLRDYIKLLGLLGADYTWFDRENCCGWPFFVDDSDGAAQKAEALSGEFNRKNVALAREKGAATLVYCCVGCAYVAKHALQGDAAQHRYVLDLICDEMEKRDSRIAPMTVGYFEGCHAFSRAHFPGAVIDWPRYRRMLGKIKGLTIVDLPNTSCCKRAPEKILESARQKKVDTILCPCNGCYRTLKGMAQDGLEVVSFPEILLRCFETA